MCLSCVSGTESLIIGSAGAAGIIKTVAQNYFIPFSRSKKSDRDIEIWQQNRSFAAEMGLDPDTVFGGSPSVQQSKSNVELEMAR